MKRDGGRFTPYRGAATGYVTIDIPNGHSLLFPVVSLRTSSKRSRRARHTVSSSSEEFVPSEVGESHAHELFPSVSVF